MYFYMPLREKLETSQVFPLQSNTNDIASINQGCPVCIDSSIVW